MGYSNAYSAYQKTNINTASQGRLAVLYGQLRQVLENWQKACRRKERRVRNRIIGASIWLSPSKGAESRQMKSRKW